MPWDRGAWERTTSGAGNNAPVYSPTKSTSIKPKVTNKKKNYLKKTLSKFLSQGWKISDKKKELYLNNNYYNAPYRLPNYSAITEKISNLISNKSNSNKILVVSNNDIILNEIQLEFSIKDNYKTYKSSKSAGQLENIVNNVEEFEKINTILFNKYAIKLFYETNLISQIADLKILSQHLEKIDNKTAKILNEFLKDYWTFYEASNFSNIDLTLAERNVMSEVKEITKDLISTKNYINRLNKILSLLDFDINNLDEFNINIIKNDPVLVDSDEVNSFLNSLNKYQEINSQDNNPIDYFKEFPSNNFILGIISNYKKYVDNQEDYKNINKDITILKNDFNSYGILINNLNQYYEIKDKLNRFNNVKFVDDNDYLILDNKLKEFLKFNVSFNEYLERCKQNIIFNLDSNSMRLAVNKSIEEILNLFEDLNIKINTLSEFDNHESDFKILDEYIKFNKNNTVANEETIIEYAMNLFNDLKGICNDILENCIEVDESDLDYIIYHISTLKRIINNMGLNVSSLNQLTNSFSIISNLENDISNSIFTSQTEIYIQNEKFTIHNDLDTLKSSMNILLEVLDDQPALKEVQIDELSQSFNNQFKLGFLKSNLESYIDSTHSFEQILENYKIIIQNALNLMDVNKNFEFKQDIDKILNEFNSISQMNADKNYSNNQLMINNISSYKSSINENFNKLVKKGLFSKNLNVNETEDNLIKLHENIDVVRDFITVNNLKDEDFKKIIKNNNEFIFKIDEFKDKLNKSNIYNFYDIGKQIDNQNHDYDIVKEILDLSLKLDIKEYNHYSNFDFNDLLNLSDSLDADIEFSEFVNVGILSKDFKCSIDELNEFDSRIKSINDNLNQLGLNNSILDDFSQVNVSEMEGIKEQLSLIEKYLKIDSRDMDELIENYKISLNMLLNLCNDHYIEFETNNHKFNSSDFTFNLEGIQMDFENNIQLYEIQKEIASHNQIIGNNLINIWEGPQTDIELVKDKLQNDEEFTKQYTHGIFTDKSISNLSDISQSDLLFLDKLKNMENQELKSKYILSYKKSDSLIPEINKLINLNDDLNSFLEIFVNINKIYKSSEISDCINLLEYNIKHTDSINIIRELENNLKHHSVTYYKFFDGRKFNMSIEEIIEKLENHLKFTQLLDSEIINEMYLDTIKNNFNDFLNQIEKLDELKMEILNDCNEYYGGKNITFDEIKESWNNIDNANLVLMNLNTLKNSFNTNYISYFDYVYIVDDNELTGEDKLHLFLISKNKISNLKLMEG